MIARGAFARVEVNHERTWLAEHRDALALGTIVLIAALVYSPAVRNGFVLDDHGIIERNPIVRGDVAAWRAFVEPYWPRDLGGGQYRPLGTLSFRLDWAFSGGAPRWFHVVNIAWHTLATALVFAFARLLMPLGAAAVAASIFAVHPVHVEAVANTVGRLELMATTFVLGGLILHARRHWAAAIAFACALLSKENAIVFIALALAMDLTLNRAAPTPRRLYGVYTALAFMWVLCMLNAVRGGSANSVSAVFLDKGLVQRLGTVVSIIPHYVRLLVWPAQLSSDYEPNVIVPFTTASSLFALGALIAIAWVCLARSTMNRTPRVLFLLLWVPIALAPVSNVFFASGIAVAERTLYLASVGVAIGFGAAWTVVPSKNQRVAAACLVALLGLGAARSLARITSWGSDRSQLLTLLQDHPESYRAHWIAGRVLKARADTAGALSEFARAAALFPRDTLLLTEWAAVLRAKGEVERARAIEDSVALLVSRRRRA